MDPIAFPVLAGSLLNEAVRFLFDRVGSVLDRRADRATLQDPEQVPGHAEPFSIRPTELSDERVDRLIRARGALEVFLAHPELLRGENAELLLLLGQLRADLEAIYGRGLPVAGEASADRGVHISQHADHVEGRQVGVQAQDVGPNARLGIRQEATTIHASGEQVGLQIEGRMD